MPLIGLFSADILKKYGLLLLALLIVVIALGGIWVGKQWATGAQAIQERAEQKQYIQDLADEIDRLQVFGAGMAINYADAVERLGEISQQQEDDREANRKHFRTQRAALEHLLRKRPDLGVERAGTDVLQHWNRSNAGPAAGATPAGAAVEPDAAVPGAAAGAERPVGNAVGQSRSGDRAVPRLPSGKEESDQCGKRVAGNRLAVVLPSAGAAEDQEHRVHG